MSDALSVPDLYEALSWPETGKTGQTFNSFGLRNGGITTWQDLWKLNYPTLKFLQSLKGSTGMLVFLIYLSGGFNTSAGFDGSLWLNKKYFGKKIGQAEPLPGSVIVPSPIPQPSNNVRTFADGWGTVAHLTADDGTLYHVIQFQTSHASHGVAPSTTGGPSSKLMTPLEALIANQYHICLKRGWVDLDAGGGMAPA